VILSCIFFALAAACNAVMDSVENEHIYDTVFNPQRKNSAFWYKRDSWDKAKKIGGWKFDAWHLFKSIAVINLCLSAAFAATSDLALRWGLLAQVILKVVILGLTWNLSFNLFYNVIFKKK
jgi:hypothetical protein